MSIRAGRPAGAGIASSFCLLLLGGLILAACGGDLPQSGSFTNQPAGSAPRLQTTPAAGPTPRGNANTSGSFGPEINAMPTLPAAPPTAPPTAVSPAPPTKAPAPTAQAPPPTQPAPPSSAGTQSQPVAPAHQDVRWRLVYVGPDGRLWSVGREGKDPQLLLDKPAMNEAPGRVVNLNLSPDATRLLYTVVGGTPSQRHFMLNLSDGSVSKQKYNGPWAADSRHVLATPGNQLTVVDVTNGAEQTLGEGANANWTTDDRIVAVRQGNIWLLPYPANSGQPRQLTSYPTTGAGAWTFLGPLQYQFTNRVLFAGAPSNTIGGRNNVIRVESVDIATKRITDLTPPTGTELRFMALSPSGVQLAVAEQTAAGSCASAGTVLVVRADGAGRPIPIGIPNTDTAFFYIRGLTWSPDQWVVYSALEQNCSGVTVNTVTGEKIFIVNPATPDAPRAFVDGSYPVWIAPRGLGMTQPGAVAER